MPVLTIQLSQTMYEELHFAAADTGELDEEVCSIEGFARECIESVLADRRLYKIPGRRRREDRIIRKAS